MSVMLVTLLTGKVLLAADNMTFRGTLNEPPPCSINNGETIEVNFQRVGIGKVNGINYRQVVNYHISCATGIGAPQVTLAVSGNRTTFDQAAIKTTKEHLGIRLLYNGQPFILDKPIPIDPKQLPLLEVVPVKEPGSWTLIEGTFEATATLQAQYQ
ncbi:hypothetical protein BLX41_31740 [Pseudomonas protegens]|uniref:fimbrial protein n=1 Tax=Pseudomonas protegens TaxID=380021 RepID=UPI000F4C6A52|nr:fimbrial protein [Pseudomonas protegens]ROL62707.1 hypothetical protein BLX41_31740 [Pseudomonas protegens]